jgi:hypothetical protein
MLVLLIMKEAVVAQDETVTLHPALRRHRRPSHRTVVPSWCQPKRPPPPAERDDVPVAGLAVQTLWVEDAVQLGMHVVLAVPLLQVYLLAEPWPRASQRMQPADTRSRRYGQQLVL